MRPRAQGEIPEDLQTFDPQLWIQAATDADDPYVRHIPVGQRAAHWYLVRIIGPAYYRQALLAAVGQRAADHYFYDVLKVQGGRTPALWADS
jgi:hypothetical protein